MIYDREFLKRLDLQPIRTVHVRITSLELDESPRETIEGRVTGGSINVDGNSAVRRTCQLSMVADIDSLTDYYWVYNTKFKLEIGLENMVDIVNYDQIIWFNQGIYFITSFSQALSTTGLNVNISGKDKMCRLNGELGGSLESSVDFGKYEQEDANGNWKTISYPVKDIILELVHHYAHEPFENIIIEDVENAGLMLQEYRGRDPIYLWSKNSESDFINATFDGDALVYQGGGTTAIKISEATFYPLSDLVDIEGIPKYSFISGGNLYYIYRISSGQAIGYTETELTYPSDLIATIGESLTSVLDKIKNFLGDFEYFYNLDGQFVFRRKRNGVFIPWTPINGDGYVENLFTDTSISYNFSDNILISSFNNNPDINNIKNDFSVWGTKKSAAGEVPVHMRYAIDKKPTYYKSISVSDSELAAYNNKHELNVKGQKSIEYNVENNVPWQEIIYQMAKDYIKYNHLSSFYSKITEANGSRYPSGVTGYEQYYIDMEGFWRQLYCPNSNEKVDGIKYGEDGWNVDIEHNPATLNFWIDFLDTNGDMEQYSVKKIGQRPKVVNDKDVQAVHYLNIPGVILGPRPSTGAQSGYQYLNIGQYGNLFGLSAQGKDAKEEVESLLYNHSYATESVTINSIPIYYLEPNSRVHVEDPVTGIDGDYIVSKMTIPLTYNGTMNITATKAVNTYNLGG